MSNYEHNINLTQLRAEIIDYVEKTRHNNLRLSLICMSINIIHAEQKKKICAGQGKGKTPLS